MTDSLVSLNDQAAALAHYRPSFIQRLARFWGIAEIPLDELRAKYENEHSRYVEVEGTRVHYRVEGQGPHLLLLHGVMAHLQTWDGWVERLSEHFTITRIDVPGFGLTGPMHNRDYTPETALRFFEASRKALGIERFSIAGNSLGGFLSWYYASHHPERVEKLILIDPLSYPQDAPAIMRFATAPIIRTIAPRCVPRPFILNSLREVYGDPSKVTGAQVRRYHDLLLRPGNRQAMIDYFDNSHLFFTLDDDGQGKYSRKIAELQCPTLLMWGEKDAWIPVRHVESFQRDVPHIQVKRYAGLGHVPMEEMPDLTARDALTFLKS